MTRRKVKPDDFSIRFFPGTLIRTEGGAVTAFIYWQFEEICFPGPKWSDFVAVVVGWWIESLRQMEKEVVLRFMDGPFFMNVKKIGRDSVLIECYEDRKEKMLVGSFQLPMEKILQELETVARAVVVEFQHRHWKSRDIDLLSRLLANEN